jgi:hypothetical protein
MKKWVKVGALFVVMLFFCTGISFAGNIGHKGTSALVVAHEGNGNGGSGDNGGNGPGDGSGNGGDGPGGGSGNGAPEGAGDCPGDA